MTLAAGTRLGVYEISSQIGEGGMGQVYRATDTKLDRDVAIKILPEAFAHDADRLARFQREAKTLASLNHPHIAAIYGLEESGGVSALVMELVEGEDLSRRIARGAIPIDEALPIAKQIAEALEAAHEQGIIHRDLKPANIKVRSDGTVKVLDFGLAKVLDTNPMSTTAEDSPTITSPAMTGSGVILGTAAYMSPEQARGKPVDKRTDLWAFGCVLYEMLTSTRPFEGDDVTDTIAAIVRAEPDWTRLPADTPSFIRKLLRHSLEKDRLRRLPDAAMIRIEIDDARNVSLNSDHLGGDDAAATRQRPMWSRALPWALVVTLSVAIFAALLVLPRWRSASAPSTRLTLLPSRDNSLSLGGGTAISPDGRMVAFVAQAGQNSSLYIRQLDEWVPRPVPLTNGATNPFFSPDGRWIAFATGNVLKKVPVSGGPPQVICRTGDQTTLGGTWRSDGTIIFGAWPQVGLWRVSADGGAPQLITQPTEGNSVWYLWPEPLPNERGILFTIWQGGRNSIAVLPPGAHKPRILVESGGRQHYVPTGHLVYIDKGQLFAVPFDLDRLAVSGGSTVVAEDVNETAFGSDYDVSTSGVLVYRPSASTASNIVWIDRHGESVPVGGGSHRYGSLALSSDGDRFSVVINEGVSRNLWTGSITSGLLTRLTFGNDDAYGLWSLDGARVFYSAGQSGYNIYAATTDGSRQIERVTRSPNAQNATSVSPRGDVILFHEVVPSAGGDIWEVSLATKESRSVLKTPFREGEAVFSPDGRWIAYQSDDSGRSEIYVQTYPGPGGKQRVSVEGGNFPSWSHSGRELFYQTATAMFAIPILDLQNLRLGAPRPIFVKTGAAAGIFGRANPSLDDQRFLMLQRADTNESTPLNVVQNWFEELNVKAPIK